MSELDITSLHTEIELMRTLSHPNIVDFHEVYESEGHFCLVQELMDGGDVSVAV
jgi:calcium/calmodulin-dependent protein kinase I